MSIVADTTVHETIRERFETVLENGTVIDLLVTEQGLFAAGDADFDEVAAEITLLANLRGDTRVWSAEDVVRLRALPSLCPVNGITLDFAPESAADTIPVTGILARDFTL